MNYDVFEQGPAVYIPVILLSLLITVIAYSVFPLLFAIFRKKGITKKKYNIFCYCVNFGVVFIFICINGSSSGAPYLLWTSIFSVLGIKVLRTRGILITQSIEGDVESRTEEIAEKLSAEKKEPRSQAPTATDAMIKIDISKAENEPLICYCRKCGTKLTEGSIFCHHCGTRIIKE